MASSITSTAARALAGSRPVKRRHSWLAALLSFLLPGLGHVYAVRLHRAGFCFVLAALLLIGIDAYRMLVPPATLAQTVFGVGLIAAAVCAHLGIVADAFVQARRHPVARLARINRVGYYAGIYLAGAAATGLSNFIVLEHGAWRGYRTPTVAMAPTLNVGDRFYTWSEYYRRREPRRGDVVLFASPSESHVTYVRRIVGLPGDDVQVRDGAVFLNGVPAAATRLESPPAGLAPAEEAWRETLPNGARYTVIRSRTGGTPRETPVYTVPADHYFVLGDNRDSSLDSRSERAIGFVPRGAIRDRATVIYWSRDVKRIGHLIQPSR